MSERPSRILVVDDEPANRALLRKLLGHHGWTVDEAEDGAQALAAIETEAPYLV